VIAIENKTSNQLDVLKAEVIGKNLENVSADLKLNGAKFSDVLRNLIARAS